MNLEVVKFLGIFLGVVLRTVFPYLDKKDIKFDYSYIYSAISSLIISLVVAAQLFLYVPIEGNSALSVFLVCLLVGWGTNDITNKAFTDRKSR